MDTPFREWFEALKHTAQAQIDANEALARAHEAMARANEAMARANAGLTRAGEAGLRANEEHEDLRDTVARLEKLVLEQSNDIRALRERLNGGGH